MALKITKGEWKPVIGRIDGNVPESTFGIAIRVEGKKPFLVTNGVYDYTPNAVKDINGNPMPDFYSIEELEANVALIAEAGNVANETGLSPRELLAQRNELLLLLEKGIELDFGGTPKTALGAEVREFVEKLKAYKTAIANPEN